MNIEALAWVVCNYARIVLNAYYADYAQFYARPICASLVVLVIWSETDHTNNAHMCACMLPQKSPKLALGHVS